MKTSNETDKAVVTFQKILGQFYKELRTVIPYTMLTKLYNTPKPCIVQPCHCTTQNSKMLIDLEL